ncbi:MULTISPECIES: L-glutamate gamma-semialdehyde dehydrogenase [Protofrankia]|uniref:L-glutamate gamma-semialdehyde dehydrogenase n=1 Tax=Protofrankia coriariae TaxID=1562887 RepID=A0ABR5F5M2_9ACTN|nr:MULTISPECIES: L-glutamate gamma-semialdehyde dehydrogenase [Protofrankia]KLL12026.1 1-pyrroline-5-carboxylate dehydrogenase [Protofrankia coriariae]ONH35313.1 1-pyrroline-5-carboxylate dehydrogenase [Protofrankia sp. BMG5.30]
MDAVAVVPEPVNEPVRAYAPGSPQRAGLRAALERLAGERAELPLVIAGKARPGAGEPFEVVAPHRHELVLGAGRAAAPGDVADAVDAALAAAPDWRALSQDDRAAVFLRAADLLAGRWRDTLNAATMLGQSKSCYQAEIDAACELIDFWRFNVAAAREIVAEQPLSAPGTWNRMDYRPLEGFVLAVTPFNFTSIAANLPTAPAIMGNTVVWKPSPTQQLAAQHTMSLLAAAGLPPGVINMVTGDGAAVSAVALRHRELAGVHFTGSTATFRTMWRTVAEGIDGYRDYPRLVGETGGKNFVVAHPSADPDALVVGLVRGAFEYQGQKCSAASRAYLPASLWRSGLRDQLVAQTAALTYGDVSDLSLFGGAVIDRRAFDRLSALLARLRADPDVSVLVGGGADDRIGFFVEPTVVVCADPTHEVFTSEYFGPVLAVHIYDDAPGRSGSEAFTMALRDVTDFSPYGLTGAVFGRDRRALATATEVLRYSAGNFYINDKPTGAVVGQQPFGGSRASGTNDKAGSALNLLRWVSPRALKETFDPPRQVAYPHMG